jgi:hypothetical protein
MMRMRPLAAPCGRDSLDQRRKPLLCRIALSAGQNPVDATPDKRLDRLGHIAGHVEGTVTGNVHGPCRVNKRLGARLVDRAIGRQATGDDSRDAKRLHRLDVLKHRPEL